MTVLTVKTESAVRTHASLLLRLHALFVNGKEDDPEADAIRDQMDEPWYAMTEQEQERVGGLSEDLYTLAEGGAKAVPMSRVEQEQWEQEARAKLRVEEPDGTLEFLRRAYPAGLPPFAIPFLQSRCWESIG